MSFSILMMVRTAAELLSSRDSDDSTLISG